MAVPTITPSRPAPPDAVPLRRTRIFSLPETRWAALALGLFALGLGAQLAGAPEPVYWTLYLACYAAGGWEPGRAGLRALRNRTLDVDLLMVVAAIGAAAIGQVTDGALLIVIFAVSGALEALATARTEDSLRGLLGLAPETTTRVEADGRERRVRAADVEVGDILVVRPGERIAADATVLDGGSEVDQATITGEPLPVDKTAGDEVFAGTLNGTGALRIRVDRRATDSVLARISALVEQAGRTKAKTQLFIEKIEQRYSIAMVVATVAVFAVPLTLGDTLERALLRAMTFMIVASPCAVVLATMPPLLAAIATAGRNGVLVKSAVVMEQLGAADRVAFDKTGTLTRGVPEVAEIVSLDPRFDSDDLLRLAAAAEQLSEHPLAGAILRAAHDRALSLPATTGFQARPGRGVGATVDGRRIAVGSPAALLPDRHLPWPAAVGELQARGHTVVVVTCEDGLVGALALTDTVRPEAADAIAATRRVTGTEAVLLSGDNEAAADRIAGPLGIGGVRAGLLPDEKVAVVRELQAGGHRVVVVGDGVNDAPALAAADAGVAMGGAGSDLTLQTADAVVVRDDLRAVAAVMALSRRAHRVVVANLCIAATFIGVLVIWDLVGTLPLPLGVAGHEGSTILVGLNGLRLLRRSAWDRASRA
ncbi:heavy metal translocating P-type ATPase [Nocardia higoensis]|uniref:heavy metal translocating P-type ATPase n=1 Tax=Nocardia higoensis TaxID=228599 RepID=UPI0002E69FD7|nr:heavy metal translocating P-type ATPase [Nocardia higoensis]